MEHALPVNFPQVLLTENGLSLVVGHMESIRMHTGVRLLLKV
jgi:hypothetical protein